MDLFGQNLIGDLLDSPVPVPTAQSDLNNDKSEVDLFADADFVSATPQSESGKAPVPQVRSPPAAKNELGLCLI